MSELKHNFVHAHLDAQGMISKGDSKELIGFYFADVRRLKTYAWQFDCLKLIQQQTNHLALLSQYWADLGHHVQNISLLRKVQLTNNGFRDTLIFTNHQTIPASINISLETEFDQTDLMSLRGVSAQGFLEQTYSADTIPLDKSGQNPTLEIASPLLEFLVNGTLVDTLPEKIELTKGASCEVTVACLLDIEGSLPMPSIDQIWQGVTYDMQSLEQSREDLYGLMFNTDKGVLIAAGLPRFSAPFGRDSLITASFCLDSCPALAKGTLLWLADHIGTKTDARNDEEPGKILHEYRWGPLSQSGQIPFAPYYGSADATSLFLTLLTDYCDTYNDWAFAEGIKPIWQSASQWLKLKIHQGKGYIRFRENAIGLKFQGWKDSPISMVHNDGQLALGDIAVTEVQGYAYSALQSCALLYTKSGDTVLAEDNTKLAKALYRNIQNQLWSDKLNCYVMGIDGSNKPIEVISSNAGHLLWSGAVPVDKAERLIERLFQPDMWSGWGIRTLANQEQGYNPVSYHNGSVWPHDTAIVALGCARYGHSLKTKKIATALFDLANIMPGNRLPELISGYSRDHNNTPISYPGTCNPQAWSAAALIALRKFR